jgi:hypothetical protein
MLMISYYQHTYGVPNSYLERYGCPDNHKSDEAEYVIAKIIERFRLTPVPNKSFMLSHQQSQTLAWISGLQIHVMQSIGTKFGEGVSAMIVDEVGYCPIEINECGCGVGNEMWFWYLPTRSLISFDANSPLEVKTNGIETGQFIAYLMRHADFLKRQAESDFNLVQSGKLTWEQIGELEMDIYTRKRIVDGGHRLDMNYPFVQWD